MYTRIKPCFFLVPQEEKIITWEEENNVVYGWNGAGYGLIKVEKQEVASEAQDKNHEISS